MPNIQGTFTLNGIPTDGATIKLWTAAAFSSPPERGDTLPSTSPLATATSGPEHGDTGEYRFTSVASGEYYVSEEYADGPIGYKYHSVLDGAQGLGFVPFQQYADWDTAVAATAVDGTLFIPPGTVINGPLTLSKRINILGGGQAFIRPSANNGNGLRVVGITTPISIKNITFDNPNGYTGTQGLVVDNCNYLQIDGVIAKSLQHGLRINNSNFIAVRGSALSGNTTAGVLASGFTNLSLEQCSWNQIDPAYDFQTAGTGWSVLTIQGIGRMQALSGEFVTILEHKPGSNSQLDLTGTTNVFSPSHIYDINPFDYGAVGDGSTDDSDAFDAMVLAARQMSGGGDSGAIIRVKPGNHFISRQIVIPRTGNTPNVVVQIIGDSTRICQFRSDTNFSINSNYGSGMVVWEDVTTRAWYQRIENVRFVVPDVSGICAIHFQPTVIRDGTDTASNILSERLNIHLENVLIEANNRYCRRGIHLEGNIYLPRIVNIEVDTATGGVAADTIALEVSSDDYGDDFGGDDRSGLNYGTVDRIVAGPRRGGRTSPFKGRTHRCIMNDINTVNGSVNTPALHLINASASTINNVTNEGRGEKPQVKLENCRNIIIDNLGLGTPNAVGAFGVGNGLELVNSQFITVNGIHKTPGNTSHSAQSVKMVTVDTDCRNIEFYNVNGVGHPSGEITSTVAASAGFYMEYTDINTGRRYALGTREFVGPVVNMTSASQLDVTLSKRQFLVQGSGAATSGSLTQPIFANETMWYDGMRVTLIGNDGTNTFTIPTTAANKIVLGAGIFIRALAQYTIWEAEYIQAFDRWVERYFRA